MVLWVRGAWGCEESVSWGLWRAAVGDQRQHLWRRCGLGAGWLELAGGRGPARGVGGRGRGAARGSVGGLARWCGVSRTKKAAPGRVRLDR